MKQIKSLAVPFASSGSYFRISHKWHIVLGLSVTGCIKIIWKIITFEWTYAWHIHHGAKQQRGHLVHVVGVCSTHMQVFDTLGCNFTECAKKNERQSWVAEWVARCSKLLSALLAVFDKNLGITGVGHTYFGRHPGQLIPFSLLGCRYYSVHKTARIGMNYSILLVTKYIILR